MKYGYRMHDFIGLPIGDRKVISRTKVQRCKCKNKNCDYGRQEHIPFVTGSCYFTRRFVKYVVGLLQTMTLKDATNLLGVTCLTLTGIHSRNLEYYYVGS